MCLQKRHDYQWWMCKEGTAIKMDVCMDEILRSIMHVAANETRLSMVDVYDHETLLSLMRVYTRRHC